MTEALQQWDKEPNFWAAYDALEKEFALAGALIKARSDVEMIQKQVALAIETQAAIVRLESGRDSAMTRTLECYAKATSMRLRISFEPSHSGKPQAAEVETSGTAATVWAEWRARHWVSTRK